MYALKYAMAEGNLSIEVFIALDLNTVIRENGNVISIEFRGLDERVTYYFYAGQNPNNI